MNGKDNKALYIFSGAILLFASAYAAPYLDRGIPGLIKSIGEGNMKFVLCKNTLKTCLIALGIYLTAILCLNDKSHDERNAAEFGSAAFGNAYALNKKYEGGGDGKILTKNVSVSLDGKYHKRNLNVLVCGGSGSGKTRFYAMPNVMNANSSFVVLDPKGEMVRETGCLLEAAGYDIKVIDLINMEKSCCYNPFKYIKDENDAQRLCTNLFKNTNSKEAKSSDPFWEKAAMMLLLAIVFYLMYEASECERNFPMVLEMIRSLDINEDKVSDKCLLDELFDELPENHIAKKYYKSFRTGSGKTLKSIQITLLSHLEKFNLTSLASITRYDELDLDKVGERKTAIFAVTSENDTSFNFIVGMLYTQLFQRLYYCADVIHGGANPVHVHFNLDEFANMPLPDDFDKILSTMRSRNISVSIIIQNMAQLKALYKDEWESIVGNCDEFLYLGGNELSTHEYVSKLIGKETIKYKTHSKGKGRQSSYTESEYIAARSLMNPDEVRTLDSSKAILFIRGEKPVIDDKFDILKHKYAPYTASSGGGTYTYGVKDYSAGDISFLSHMPERTGIDREEDKKITVLTDLDYRKIRKGIETNEN